MYRWFKKWFLDGWLTTGHQVACSPGQIRAFTMCLTCNRVFPHWLASMTASEAKRRGKIGCACGGMKIQPVILPWYKSVWWFLVRGWLIRKLILRKRLWDPRLPVLHKEMV